MQVTGYLTTDLKNQTKVEQELASTTKLILIDLYANCCGSCKMLAQILEQLSRDNKDVMIVKIKVDDNQNLAARFAIRSIPTILIFKNGENKETINGVLTQTTLEAKLNTYQ